MGDREHLDTRLAKSIDKGERKALEGERPATAPHCRTCARKLRDDRGGHTDLPFEVVGRERGALIEVPVDSRFQIS